MLVVGFHGEAGAGKNTAASQLPHGMELAFAEPLKEAAAHLCGFKHHQLYGTKAQKEAVDPFWGFSARQFLQKLGSQLRALFGGDFFVRRMRHRVDLAGEIGYELVCITDVRFPEEAALVREYGGLVIHLLRGPDKTPEEVAALHESERPLPPECIDAVIRNDGTLAELRDAVQEVLNTRS